MQFKFEIPRFGKKKEKKVEEIIPPETRAVVEYKPNHVDKPIRACLIDFEMIRDTNYSGMWDELLRIQNNGLFVDYDGANTFLKENHLRNAGSGTYVISSCDEKDKYSFRYQDCTGIVIVGEDKKSGGQVSVMTHQNPNKFLNHKRKKFEEDLTETIKDIKTRTKPNSLDVVIFGGQVLCEGDSDTREKLIYKESIKEIEKITAKEFGFTPVVMTGPNVRSEENPTAAYFDTKNRRLYLIRPSHSKINEYNNSFLSNELK